MLLDRDLLLLLLVIRRVDDRLVDRLAVSVRALVHLPLLLILLLLKNLSVVFLNLPVVFLSIVFLNLVVLLLLDLSVVVLLALLLVGEVRGGRDYRRGFHAQLAERGHRRRAGRNDLHLCRRVVGVVENGTALRHRRMRRSHLI